MLDAPGEVASLENTEVFIHRVEEAELPLVAEVGVTSDHFRGIVFFPGAFEDTSRRHRSVEGTSA